MKFYLDTEFYEDGRTIDLISIGVVCEDGREFYAVNRDADLSRVSRWVRENVLPSLPPDSDPAWKPRAAIAYEMESFVTRQLSTNDKPEFYGYYADYDWVVVCQMFGTMMDLPKSFPMFCMDLKQLSVSLGNPQHPPDPVGEHNTLIDARWNRDLHRVLCTVERLNRIKQIRQASILK